MRENVHYARCVCDFCKTEEHIADSLILPKGWDTITVENCKYELCKSCSDRVKLEIERIIKSF